MKPPSRPHPSHSECPGAGVRAPAGGRLCIRQDRVAAVNKVAHRALGSVWELPTATEKPRAWQEQD